jgi:hypothetical protein
MGKKWFKNPAIWIGVVLLVVVVWAMWPGGSGNYNNFAACLSESGAVMYGTEWCSHCQNQKALFGKSFDNINFVDCDQNREDCLAAGVGGYPTWKINGENYPGEQSMQRLADLSGCDLVKDE